MYQISSKSPEFCRRYYKKNILISFWTQRIVANLYSIGHSLRENSSKWD